MKAPVRTARRIPAEKKRVRVYSNFIYKIHKEAHPAGAKYLDFLASRQLRFPRPLLLRLVSSEAFRLSKRNRLGIVTSQEIDAAVTLVQRRIHSRAAA
ncbi:histone H2B-like [Cyprinodon tularosa]|uniref:histone H2B-like n=1 Tax=Cyprinodon tularosa TaxID=77115 RepID=UPI0018E28A0C|nr:histone H2B-like [Cyprinodon tularosa]